MMIDNHNYYFVTIIVIDRATKYIELTKTLTLIQMTFDCFVDVESVHWIASFKMVVQTQ